MADCEGRGTGAIPGPIVFSFVVAKMRTTLGGRRACLHAPRVFDLTTAAVIYCALIAAAFIGLWRWYDRRDHQRFEQERRKTTFHCIRCDALYVAPSGTELCKCPKCGHQNSRLKF